MTSGVTWGWCIHELSTTLVQIPDLNISPGHCQLSSVTRAPRGSSYSQHPSCCSLACVQQPLIQALLLETPSPAPSWQLVMLSQHLSCSNCASGKLEKKLPCPADCSLRDMYHSNGTLQRSLQAASTSTSFSAKEETESQTPDPCHPGHSSLLFSSRSSKIALKFAIENPNFALLFSVKTEINLGKGH